MSNCATLSRGETVTRVLINVVLSGMVADDGRKDMKDVDSDF